MDDALEGAEGGRGGGFGTAHAYCIARRYNCTGPVFFLSLSIFSTRTIRLPVDY